MVTQNYHMFIWFAFSLGMWLGEMGLSCSYKRMSLTVKLFQNEKGTACLPLEFIYHI